MSFRRGKKAAMLVHDFLENAVVDGGVRRQIKALEGIRIAFGIGFDHLRRVIEHNVVDLMADDEQDFLQREFAQEQRVCMKHRRKPIQQNARDASAGEIHVIGQIHQKIAVIAVPLGNEKQLHQLQHIDAIGFDFIQYRSAALALLDGGNIQFHIRQQLDDIRLHSAFSDLLTCWPQSPCGSDPTG